MNKIRESIGLYNQRNKLKGRDKMTQQELAEIVFKDRNITDEAKHQLMSACIYEKRKMTFAELRKTIIILGCVDVGFILGL